MKKILVCFFLISFLNLNAQKYEQLISDAEGFYNSGKFVESVKYYEKAFKINNENATDLYNGACSSALQKNKKTAFKWLNLSIDKGWTNLNHLKTDTDLNNLHLDKKWKPVLDKLEKKLALIEANYDKPLQKELLEIYTEDQKYRMQINEISSKYGKDSNELKMHWKIITSKDSTNLIKIKKILDEKGWVGKNKVGSQASETLFLVIQHSDIDTQKKYLPMMKDAVSKGNASSSSLALLLDRIEIREGRKQIYGSQIGTNPLTKKQYVLPLLDPDNVDKRRKEVGLDSLTNYVKNWNLTWNVEDYKKELPELEKIGK